MKWEGEQGGMWEGYWEIIDNVKCSENGGGEPCKHCKNIRAEERTNKPSGMKYYVTVWDCPYIVVANNEGSFNSTGVCLDCIIELAEKVRS